MNNEPEETPGIPEWVVTFGDMMSLLLTFFIMLVSLSEVKQNEKYQALIDSLQRRFGHDSAPRSMAPGPQKPRSNRIAPNQNAGRARLHDLHVGGNDTRAPRGDEPLVSDVRHGEVTTIGGVIHFAPGVTRLGLQQQTTLTRVVEAIRGKPQKVEIRGHAARGFIEGRDQEAADRWQLCYQRCVATRAFLVAGGVAPHLIRLSQAGEHEPLWLEPNLEKQRANARVEVFLTSQFARNLQGTADEREREAVR